MGLGIFKIGGYFSFFCGLGILTFGVLVFLRLKDRDSYVWGLGILSFRGSRFLRLWVSVLTFES